MSSTPIEPTKPDPRDITRVVDLISASVKHADQERSLIINFVEIYLDGIRLLSAWENPVPGADKWFTAASKALKLAKNVRWTPPPQGSRAGPEDVQALQTFLEAIPTLRAAVDELTEAQAPLDVRIAARGIRANFECEAREADVLDQVHRATGIPRGTLAGERGNWLAAAWEATERSSAWTRRAAKLKAYLNGAITKNKKRLSMIHGKPGELGTEDRDRLEVDKRAAKRLERGKSYERRKRVEHPELTPGVEDGVDPRLVAEPGATHEPSKYHQIELEGEDLLIAIEEMSRRNGVVETFRRDEASKKELELLNAMCNGAETFKEMLAATGGNATRSEYQSLQRKLTRRWEREISREPKN